MNKRRHQGHTKVIIIISAKHRPNVCTKEEKTHLFNLKLL